MDISEIKNFVRQQSGLILLISLTLFLAVPIIVSFLPFHSGVIFAFIYSTLVFAGIIALTDRRRHFWTGFILGFISLTLMLVNIFSEAKGSREILMTLSLLLFLIFLATHLFRRLLKKGEVTIDTIYVSVSGFLVIGIIGGLLFEALEIALPGSFNNIDLEDKIFDLHYLSFVTITSLGFGDITPGNPAAKSLTILISTLGQLYLTVVVAIIIGKYFQKTPVSEATHPN